MNNAGWRPACSRKIPTMPVSGGLRKEAQEKLARIRPRNIGQASVSAASAGGYFGADYLVESADRAKQIRKIWACKYNG